VPTATEAMRAPLTTTFLDETDFAAWTALVDGAAGGSVYANPVYLDALCTAAGGRFRVLAARRGDELLGGVALYESPSTAGIRCTPRLLLYYNGLVIRDAATRYPSQRTARGLEICTALEAALAAIGASTLALRQRPPFDDARVFLARGWQVRPSYTYVVGLGDLAAAWERVEQNLRRLVKRCTEQGMQVAEDDDFDAFLRMHAATVERKAIDAYLPPAAFARFFDTLRAAGLCRLYVARLPDGQPIAAQLVLAGKHPVTHSVAAATDAAQLNSGVTALLRWKVFEALAAAGYAANDLTDAALGPVAHFKSQLGGELETCLVLDKSAPPAGWRQRLATLAGFGGRG